jgi:hypothetical protein
MRGLVPQLVAAVLLFGLGWFSARMASESPGVFRLSVDAPTGETRLKCEGCQFLTWTTEGHAGERQSTVNVSCNSGPCSQAFGAVVHVPEPTLIARSTAGDQR